MERLITVTGTQDEMEIFFRLYNHVRHYNIKKEGEPSTYEVNFRADENFSFPKKIEISNLISKLETYYKENGWEIPVLDIKDAKEIYEGMNVSVSDGFFHFMGRVESVKTDTDGSLYATIIDQEDESFDKSLQKIKLIPTYTKENV